MANPIRIPLSNPDDALRIYGAGAVLRLESSATGAWAGEESEVATEALVSGTTLYLIDDPNGVTGTWYRHRLSTAVPAAPADYSEYSEAYQGGIEAGLCSLADVKSIVLQDPTDNSHDAEILDLIVQATEEIENHTGRSFLPDPATGTKTIYPESASEDGRTLWLPKGVRSVSYLGVAYSDQPDNGTGTYTAITSFWIDPPEIDRDRGWPGTRLTLGSTGALFSCWKRGNKVTGAFGWASVPRRIAGIARTIVVREYQSGESTGTFGVTIVGSPDFGTKILRHMNPADAEYLDGFRDPMVG